ncbi:MAG: hypothetical protein ACKV2T_42090 [Kofleriaceae bacterium]
MPRPDDFLFMKSETVVLDRTYEQALKKLNLRVEYGVDDHDMMTVPIQVVRGTATVPLPKSMLATLPSF